MRSNVSIIALDEFGRELKFNTIKITTQQGVSVKPVQVSPYKSIAVVSYPAELDISIELPEFGGVRYDVSRVLVNTISYQVVLTPQTRQHNRSVTSAWRSLRLSISQFQCPREAEGWFELSRIGVRDVFLRRSSIVNGEMVVHGLESGRYLLVGYCGGRLVGAEAIDIREIDLERGSLGVSIRSPDLSR